MILLALERLPASAHFCAYTSFSLSVRMRAWSGFLLFLAFILSAVLIESFHSSSHFPALNFRMAASMSFARTPLEDRKCRS